MSEGALRPEGALECVELRERHAAPFAEFCGALLASGDTDFFLPHPFDEAGRAAVLGRAGRDLYLALTFAGRMVGYGLLRGWDEGYEIPSLGIAIHPQFRGYGCGRLLMNYLHVAAALRGASKVRLRVHQGNGRAIALYESLGYRFEPGDSEYRTAFLTLGRDSPAG